MNQSLSTPSARALKPKISLMSPGSFQWGDAAGPGLTVHVQALHYDGQFHLTRHVPQRAHGHSQLLLGDEAIAVSVQNPKGLSDLYKGKAKKVQCHKVWSTALKWLAIVGNF